MLLVLPHDALAWIFFVVDILRVKEVYVDFIDNYLNAEHKFLDNSVLAERFTAFPKKYDSLKATPYLNFTSRYGMFSHSVLTDAKGKSILCKTYKFRSLGAFLYYDLFSGIETNYLPKRWKGNTFLDSFLEERLPEFDRAFVTQRPMNSFVVKPINIGHQLGP